MTDSPLELTTIASSRFSYSSRETNGLVRVGDDPRLHRIMFIPDVVLLHPLVETDVPDSDDDFEVGHVNPGDRLIVDSISYTVTLRPHNCPILVAD